MNIYEERIVNADRYLDKKVAQFDRDWDSLTRTNRLIVAMSQRGESAELEEVRGLLAKKLRRVDIAREAMANAHAVLATCLTESSQANENESGDSTGYQTPNRATNTSAAS